MSHGLARKLLSTPMGVVTSNRNPCLGHSDDGDARVLLEDEGSLDGFLKGLHFLEVGLHLEENGLGSA